MKHGIMDNINLDNICFKNGSQINCIGSNSNNRSKRAYDVNYLGKFNETPSKTIEKETNDLLSWLSDEMKEYKEHNVNKGHYVSVGTGVSDFQLFNYNAFEKFTTGGIATDNLTLNIEIADLDPLKNTKKYIDNNAKGEKEMTKTNPKPRNYTILPEIDDYKIYKDKQGRDVAMVVTFTDGTKTKAVCNYDEGDKFDVQSGLAICFMRRLLGDVNIDPKKLDDDKKKSLGYTEYNRFMRKTIRNHEKKIKQAEKEKERKAKELKERQDIDAKRREKNQKKELEKLSPIIDILKGLNLNDAMETLRNMTNDNK